MRKGGISVHLSKRERETDRQRERDRDRDRERQRERNRERQRERQRGRVESKGTCLLVGSSSGDECLATLTV